MPASFEGGRRRRRHSDEFKADAVAACTQPGMSMAAVAMAHGINANLLRRWVHEAEMKPASDTVCAALDDGAKAQEPKTVVSGQPHHVAQHAEAV
jgi:transposase